MPRFRRERELLQIAQQKFYTNNSNLDPSVVERDGSDANLMAAAGAGMAGAISAQVAEVHQKLSMFGNRGDDLDVFIYDRFGLTRNDAKAAVGLLRMQRPSATDSVVVPAGTRVTTVNSDQSVEFVTLQDVSFGAADLGPFDVLGTATSTGSNTNVLANTITEFVDQPSDASITVTNPEEMTGGQERESDDDFRQRAIKWWDSVEKATLSAIEYGAAEEIEGVSNPIANEVKDLDGLPYGQIDLVLGGVNGVGNSALITVNPTAMDEWKPAGVYVRRVVGRRTFVTINIDPTWEAGTNTTTARQSAKQSIAAHVNALKYGQNLEISLISKAAKMVPGLILSQGDLTEPSNDLIADSDERIMTRPDLVIVNGF